MSDELETNADPKTFDFDAFPKDTLFYDRRTEKDRRAGAPRQKAIPATEKPKRVEADGERRAKKERRKRIDPTTFEKQYTEDEMEFMTAMQRFKVRTGKSFPSHGEVLDVVFSLGYRKPIHDDLDDETEEIEGDSEFEILIAPSESRS